MTLPPTPAPDADCSARTRLGGRREVRAVLLSVGGTILELLDSPATVSALWERFQSTHSEQEGAPKITFDWFALALTVLFAMGAIDWTTEGRLERPRVIAPRRGAERPG